MFCCSIYISSVSVLRIGVSCYDTFAHTSLQESRVRGSSVQTADGDFIVRAPGLHLVLYSYSGCDPEGSMHCSIVRLWAFRDLFSLSKGTEQHGAAEYVGVA